MRLQYRQNCQSFFPSIENHVFMILSRIEDLPTRFLHVMWLPNRVILPYMERSLWKFSVDFVLILSMPATKWSQRALMGQYAMKVGSPSWTLTFWLINLILSEAGDIECYFSWNFTVRWTVLSSVGDSLNEFITNSLPHLWRLISNKTCFQLLMPCR